MTDKPISSDVVWHHATVTRERREELNGHKSVILWFTGLSGAGKSSLAHAVEEQSASEWVSSTFVFDGDNVRHGLCGDLTFSIDDRTENIRRVGEMSKLFLEAGVIALTAFISPLRADRERVRSLVPHGDFLEVYCRCGIETFESRVVKGLYKKARAGEIKEFTGVSSPYEEPEDAEVVVDTDKLSLEASVAKVIARLCERGIIPEGCITPDAE